MAVSAVKLAVELKIVSKRTIIRANCVTLANEYKAISYLYEVFLVENRLLSAEAMPQAREVWARGQQRHRH